LWAAPSGPGKLIGAGERGVERVRRVGCRGPRPAPGQAHECELVVFARRAAEPAARREL